MATWIAHLRVGEKMLKRDFNLEVTPFLIGNIGPDSGVPNEDWSSFNPPKKVTHWLDKDKKTDAEGFWNKYLSNLKVKEDKERYSFLLGYYVHLLTDIQWSKLYKKKKELPLYKNGLEKDSNFIWTIKKDWYGLDYLYLSKNPQSMFFTVFKNVRQVPDYLDYFPKGAFELQVKYITQFYLGENEETKENFIYITEEEMDKFIEEATEEIASILKEKLC
ncbi:zinc dependent phospholipase C family protein [Clostridium tunisiense]|uniref:zinc dependent phospholipase C family protein n=1 Tax=Clostridium tunisiense TaxID=219748 RepID=UPI0003140D2A|nr:zinc dependent phospholipase C family protein [Clostridium tunisiense]